jgi:hypothetical protein
MAFTTRLNAAITVEEVVALARDYLRVWAAVLHRVPAECRPRRLEHAGDVLTAAVKLEEIRRRMRKAGRQVGHELDATADFFSVAARKINQLQSARARDR